MKKTLSVILAMLMLLSVFVVSSFAATAPEVSSITSTFDGVEISWEAAEDAATYIVYRDGVVIGTTVNCSFVDENVEEGVVYSYKVAAQAKDQSFAEATDSYEVEYSRPYCDHKDCEVIIDYPATVFKAGLKHKHCKTCGFDLPGEVIKQLVPEAPVIYYLSNAVKSVPERAPKSDSENMPLYGIIK